MPKPLDDNLNKVARDFTKNRGETVRAAEWREDGLWVIVLSMGGRNFCTYIGLPIDHPLAGYHHDLLPVGCHGGLTFSGEGDGKYRPEGYYWYGWDYGHAGDKTWYGDDTPDFEFDEKDWTLGEVKDDARSAIYDMSTLKRLSESIYSKAKQ